MPRRYRSALRAAHARQTRERLIEAAARVVEKEGFSPLTLPRVARAARVSVPTAYAHFATTDELMREILAWIRVRIGMTVQRLLESSVDEVLAMPAETYPRFEQHADLLRVLIEAPSWNRMREAAVPARARRAAALFRGRARRWPAGELEAAVGAVYLFGTPQAWRWLRDTWQLDADAARRVALWGMQVVAAAIFDGPPSLAPRGKRRTTTRGART